MDRRVVITGMGIVSCLGNDAETVSRSLREGRSGIRARQEQIDMGLRSHVAGAPEVDIPARITSYNVCYTKLLRGCCATRPFFCFAKKLGLRQCSQKAPVRVARLTAV